MSDGVQLTVPRRQTLRETVRSTISEYLQDVDEEFITELHAMVLAEVEAPLLEAVMQKARSNQSNAARMLGLNRGTLRKKLRQYGLL
ncbi:MAG: DNA-binding transcriptional regulator Fis [Pseudohongiellaceae bacterium]|jgi:Fis family transcriptional regulator